MKNIAAAFNSVKVSVKASLQRFLPPEKSGGIFFCKTVEKINLQSILYKFNCILPGNEFFPV